MFDVNDVIYVAATFRYSIWLEIEINTHYTIHMIIFNIFFQKIQY